MQDYADEVPPPIPPKIVDFSENETTEDVGMNSS